uniref:Immunoglobulin V-set domain-containing protein n=1 Tax=Cyanoderma ruficeps TaxID=181631 RepID=A0A8C3NYA2_9PASS
MHLAHLILAVFLGQLLGKSWLFPKALFFFFLPPRKPSTSLSGSSFEISISDFRGLLWYQLRKGQGPQLLSYQAGTGPKHSGRITTHLNTTGKSSVLKVQQVELSDSALYLCPRAASVFLPRELLEQPRLHGHT